MSAAVTLLGIVGLAVAAIHLTLDRRRPDPPEFDDIAALQQAQRTRAAMRRITTMKGTP